MGNSHSKALKMTNKLIETMKSNSNIQSMMELYGDEEVLLVFKRSLAEKLVVSTSIHEYLNNRSFGAHQVNWGLRKSVTDLNEFRKTCPNYLTGMK